MKNYICKVIIILILTTFPLSQHISFLIQKTVAEEYQAERIQDSSKRGFIKNFSFFAQSLQKQIDYEKLTKQVKKISTLTEFNIQDVKKIVQIGRQQGIFLKSFIIQKKDIISLNPPLFVFLQGEGWVLVTKISKDGVKYIGLDEVIHEIPKAVFINKWNRAIVSLPLVNLMAQNLQSFNEREKEEKRGKFLTIYCHHEAKFSKLKPHLEKLIRESKKSGKKLLYIDELGLIPYETVHNRMEKLNISQKEAFNQIKQSIFKEDDMLEKGIPITLPDNPLYNQLYKFLAKHKVKSVVEDLDYELWKKIVEFDKKKFYSEAIDLFITGNFKNLILTMTQFVHGFWAYNVGIRDVKFKAQIEDLMKEYPNAIIFTIRGAGHYDMLEKLKNQFNFIVKILFIGKRPFKSNFVNQQLVHIYDSNNVKIFTNQRILLLVRSIPQEMLRQFLETKYDNFMYSTRQSKFMIKELSITDLKALSKFLNKKIKEQDNIENMSAKKLGKLVYKWIEKKSSKKENNF